MACEDGHVRTDVVYKRPGPVYVLPIALFFLTQRYLLAHEFFIFFLHLVHEPFAHEFLVHKFPVPEY